QDEKYYAIKNINNTKVTTGTGTCSYDEATNTYLSVNLVSQELVDNLQEQLDDLTDEINNLKSLGTAAASDIMSGKNAVVNGNLITGTKTDKVLKIYTFPDDNVGNTAVRSINVSAIVQDFSSLTVDNLVLEARSSSNNLNTRNMTFFKTYNASTGIYTYYVVGASLNNDTLFTKVTPKLYYVE
ncbi:MAG: hypothetical protein PHN42_04900, partial [Bacilli bacterium]|nr:hypothetical protein [Bacilli bacterium]